MILFHLYAKMNEEKVKIKLNIAGESFLLSVPYSQQEDTRQTEEEVNSLFDTWRNRFPAKSDREILAMIAFRYADHYATLRRERQETRQEIGDLTARLDALIGEKRDLP